MIDRRPLVYLPLLVAGLAVLGALSLVPVAASASPSCAAVTGDVSYATLQEAVDAASPRATVRVRGTCEGEVTIGKDLTLKGRGAATVQGDRSPSSNGLVTVDAGATVTIDGLTITRQGSWGIINSGTLRVIRSTIGGNEGGVLSNGSLTLSQSSVSGNRSGRAGIKLVGVLVSGSAAIKDSTITGNEGQSGGGIDNLGRLTIARSTISDNVDEEVAFHCIPCRQGGGIRNEEGSLTVTRSTISGNRAIGRGGGIASWGGSVTLKGSTVSGNTAGAGGGITDRELPSAAYPAGSVTLLDSTVVDNAATGWSTPEGELVEGTGGGILNEGRLALAGSSSVTENKALEPGGGIFNAESEGATIGFAPHWRGTISGNEPDDLFNG